jgi:hypothetical protein
MAHTPGPWLYDAETGAVSMADDLCAEIATVLFENTDETQTDADGRLIASAPDLLAALIALADEADRIGNALSAKGQGATVLGMRARAARAAIARATQPNPANPLRGED